MPIETESVLAFILIGALAGWLAGKLTRGRGFGIIANTFIGILGALIGGFLFNLAAIRLGGFWGSLLVATVGAIILLFFARLLGGRW